MDSLSFWQLVWLLLPAGAANMAPIFAKKLNILNNLAKPIDNGSGVLGDNKTWRGLIAGAIMGAIAASLAHLIHSMFSNLSSAAFFGFMLGIFALAGDATGSLIKRKLKLAPGEMLPIMDQLDWVVPSIFLIALFYKISLILIIQVIVGFSILTLIFSCVGVFLKIKEKI